MPVLKKTKQKAEFGDFQTPRELAADVCRLLSGRGLHPASVLEPTCGLGNFLVASLEVFPELTRAVGVDINQDYVCAARAAVEERSGEEMAEIVPGDFFETDWSKILASLPDPLLVIGNPPWVTNAELGNLHSSNLPHKSNFQMRRGIEAITGQGNFDISEWMLIKALEWIRGRAAIVAMLCKTAVARKVLLHAWKFGHKLEDSGIYEIDATKHFGAAVEACLLVVTSSKTDKSYDCLVHRGLSEEGSVTGFGYRNHHLVANVEHFERWKHLEGKEWYQWRSGIKHDCSKVMEFTAENNLYRNGMGDIADLEQDYLYPMLKSSDVANGPMPQPRRWMLVTQRVVGEDTSQIRDRAPNTWRYLEKYANLLDGRSSSIYRRRPRFSIFGVGDYSFAPWKVAVSGFYKKLDFKVVGPHKGKPVVLDDTCYFLSCSTRAEANLLARLLNSDTAKEFFDSLVFWDAKRPITVALLRRLDLLALARELNLQSYLNQYLCQPTAIAANRSQPTLPLW